MALEALSLNDNSANWPPAQETRLSIAIDPAPLQFDDDDMFPSRHNDTLDLDEDDEDDGGQ